MAAFDGSDGTPTEKIDLWISNLRDCRSISGADLWRTKLPGDIGSALDLLQAGFWEYLVRKYPDEVLDDVLRSLLTAAANHKFIGDFLADIIEQSDQIAAFGLILVDRVANAAHEEKNGWEYFSEILNLGECQEYVGLASSGAKSMAEFIAQGRIKEVARAAGVARHADTPQAAAKKVVRECWQAWEEKPSQYTGTAAFARAMLDKFPDELRSQPVIERWVRYWRNGID